MSEFIEVHTTIEGHERAAELIHGILGADLATSIDISEVPRAGGSSGDITTWELTFITPARRVPDLERHIKERDGGLIVSLPVTHDLNDYPDWLADGQG
ncbi:hypothetical protein [Nonomuraea jiangxiensis]|uniref:Divalent cation tolerance protein n=1 Tax=Nonomuraea jiangxiensis TaxID=633440 RepID=A0A1G9V9C8_9ACTN|nr:hypothetical protein [Nonomuraea jiangxiensis]SDM68495.1 hypothetical protein SAMN05421869_15215 [Nonomuraea jiangxiensis]